MNPQLEKLLLKVEDSLEHLWAPDFEREAARALERARAFWAARAYVIDAQKPKEPDAERRWRSALRRVSGILDGLDRLALPELPGPDAPELPVVLRALGRAARAAATWRVYRASLDALRGRAASRPDIAAFLQLAEEASALADLLAEARREEPRPEPGPWRDDE